MRTFISNTSPGRASSLAVETNSKSDSEVTTNSSAVRTASRAPEAVQTSAPKAGEIASKRTQSIAGLYHRRVADALNNSTRIQSLEQSCARFFASQLLSS